MAEKVTRRYKPPPGWADNWHPDHFGGVAEYIYATRAWAAKIPEVSAVAAMVRKKLKPYTFNIWTNGRWGHGLPKYRIKEDGGSIMPMRRWWFSVQMTESEYVKMAYHLYTLRGNPDSSTLHCLLCAPPRLVLKYIPECELLEAYRIVRTTIQASVRMLEDKGYGDWFPTDEEWERFKAEEGFYQGGLVVPVGSTAPRGVLGRMPANPDNEGSFKGPKGDTRNPKRHRGLAAGDTDGA